MIKLCCFAIGVSLILNVVSQYSKEYASLAELCAVIGISTSALYLISQIIEYISSKTDGVSSEYITTLIKIAGVCFCISISSDVCAQSGYQTLGKILTLAGKAEIIVMLLPFVTYMLSRLSQYL